MAQQTYTVVKGDTLSEIAVRFNTTVAKLCELNDIPNPDYIVVGQVLIISGDPASNKNTTSRANVTVFGLLASGGGSSERTVYAKWTWSKSNTENYQVRWWYKTEDGVSLIGEDSTVEHTQATYTAPENAAFVSFYVKPVSKTKTVNGKETKYWTADWSTKESYYFKDNPPSTPDVPDVKLDKLTLTATLDGIDYDINATEIQFQVVKNDSTVYKTGLSKITTSHASYSCPVEAGNRYKVRCRAKRDDKYSEWTNYSNNVSTAPSVPSKITECRAASKTSVYLAWEPVATAKTYDIEYAIEKRYFDNSDATTTKQGIEFNHFEVTGLETGDEYFFRVRAVNEDGQTSGWSEIVSIAIGKDPAAPTTWSSSPTVEVGMPLTLYWVHNAQDGSSQTYAELEMYVGGVKETHTIKNSEDEDEKDKTSLYPVDTSKYGEGTKIQWRVRTAGVTKNYGDWSVQRTVDIYARPTLQLEVTDANGDPVTELTSFPLYIKAFAGPNTQTPIGYHLSIVSSQAYETSDETGHVKNVNAGDEVYSKHFDTNEQLLVELSAGFIDLENNISYSVVCTVTMDSGLSTTDASRFTVAWTDDQYEPNAEIGVDMDTYTAWIRPYCEDENGELIEGITLSVYRREFDGTFTEIATGLKNTQRTYVTDPHPSLDLARYRVVAISDSTGAVSYYDVPGYNIGESAIIIQWDEKWSNFDSPGEEPLAEPPWSGSLLRLPYNIDVSDSVKPDVTYVKYAGRAHPVSYYGTHLGHTATWNVDIVKDDKETIYALRRLAIWSGDVYVREPSGTGYWASIVVDFKQTHCNPVVPVTLSITRVEGGV